MRRAVWLAVVMAAASAQAQVPPKPEVVFWQWFARNEVKFAAAAQKNPVAPMNAISDQLEKVVLHGLVAELTIDPTPGGKNTVVISADGDPKLFPTVKAVVAAAPPLERWKVVAFRQRRSPDERLELAGKAYTLGDFAFRELSRDHRKLNLEVLVRGLKEKGDPSFMQVVLVLLDGIVGEYDMETKVGTIELAPLPDQPGQGNRPLKELATVVDSL